MRVVVSGFQTVAKGIVKYITDLKYFCKQDFFLENYYKHLIYSMVISYLGALFFSDTQTDKFLMLFLGGFILYGINYIREWLNAKILLAPFSWTDINFGSYGGIVGVIIYILLNV